MKIRMYTVMFVFHILVIILSVDVNAYGYYGNNWRIPPQRYYPHHHHHVHVLTFWELYPLEYEIWLEKRRHMRMSEDAYIAYLIRHKHLRDLRRPASWHG